MRAIVVDRWTEPDQLAVREIAEPALEPGQIKVDVRAAGCNFFDILIVQGRYQVKPPFPFVPGGEIAGLVRELGEGVEDFAVGDRVLAAPGVGGFAECAVVDAAGAFELPDAMSFEEGAALPIVYPTSYAGLVFRADLCAGEDLLVHAAAGGVGLAGATLGLHYLRRRAADAPGGASTATAVGAAPEYGDWRDVYLERWRWDKIVRSSHFVNCWYQAHCCWNVYVKDGMVWRE